MWPLLWTNAIIKTELFCLSFPLGNLWSVSFRFARGNDKKRMLYCEAEVDTRQLWVSLDPAKKQRFLHFSNRWRNFDFRRVGVGEIVGQRQRPSASFWISSRVRFV